MDLGDRSVVITGAASGIGRALARRVAAEHPRAMVLADLNIDRVADVADEVGGVAVRTDVSQEREIRALVARANEICGPIDLFCSNAGVPGPGGGPEGSDEEWQQAWKVNVMAHVWAARCLLPDMVARGDGYLLSTASAAGLLTQVGALAYSVTKHGAVALAEWLAINYADAGVKVSCVCPLGVRTPMLEHASREPIGMATMLRDDLLEPEEVAEAIVGGVREERFLILPHESVARYMVIKGARHDRWLEGMRELVRSARAEHQRSGS